MTEPDPKAGFAALDQQLHAAREAGQLPSVVAATFRNGGLVWSGSAGRPASQFRIGSITKTFTAAAVMRLRDEGRIDLSDPIGRHVSDAPYADRTIRDLLAHHSGMTAEPAGPWWERSVGGSWHQLVAANVVERSVFAAGQVYHYSNLGFALLGELVARTRHSSWFDAVRSELLEPLGLSRTTYHPVANAAIGTSRNPRTGQLVVEPAYDTGAMAPAGQLWSTVEDLARWADFLATGDDQVLARPTLVEMRTAHSAEPDTQHRGAYGLGLRLDWTPTGTLVGHTGSMPGFVAGLFVDPVTRIGAVALTNATTGLGPAGLFAELIRVTSDVLPPKPPGVDAEPPDAVAELVGDWFWGNTAMSLEATPGGFVLSERGTQRHFVVAGEDRFRGVDGYFAGEELTVVRRDEAVAHLEVVTFIFTREPYDERAPIPGGPPVDLSVPDSPSTC